MPDGDIINIKLGYYRKSYRMICEGKLDDAECANAVLGALRKQIKREGDIVIDITEVICSKLKQNSHLVSNQTHELRKIFDKVLRESGISTNTSGILNNAVNSLVHDLKYGNILAFSNFRNEIIKRYITETYKSSFTGRVNSATEHHFDTPTKEVQKKLQQIDPKICETIDLWSSKLSRGETTIKGLRLPRIKRKKIALEENLL